MKYYIAENGQPAGPFEPNELLMHGLTVNSLVWTEGMPNWVSASQVPELMAVLTGQPVTPTYPTGGVDTQLPQTPPYGGTQPPMPYGPSTQPTTPYGQADQPYAQPQYGPSNQQQNIMPKTWLTESVLVTVLSCLCCCNVIGLITGIVSIVKANGVKTKFMAGDINGANANSSSAKMWMIVTIIIGVVSVCFQTYQLMSNPELLQQIKDQMGLLGY